MPDQIGLLIEKPDRWIVMTMTDGLPTVDAISSAVQEPVQWAEQVMRVLRRRHVSPLRVVVLLDERSVYSCSLQLKDQKPPRNDRALAYQLEPMLPVAAEQYVTAIGRQWQDSLWAVACPIQPLASCLEQLATYGIHPIAVSTRALMVGQYWLNQYEETVDVLIVELYGAPVSFMSIRDRRPYRWQVNDTALAFDPHLHLQVAENQTRPVVVVLTDERLDRLTSVWKDHADIQRHVLDPEPLLFEAAGMWVTGRCQPWIDLCKPPLTMHDRWTGLRRSVQWLVLAWVILMAVTAAILWWRAESYNQVCRQLINEQQAVAGQVLPQAGRLVGVRSRLVSRLHELAGQSDRSGVPNADVVLAALATVLNNLPDEMRFQITELQLTDQRIHLEGRCRSHAEVERLIQMIAKNLPYNLQRPRTEQVGDRAVSFTVVGQSQQDHAMQRMTP